MSDPSRQWMPRDQWDALVRGESCPLCAECQSPAPANAEGYHVAHLSLSRLRLARNQYVPGYCVLICMQHMREPYHLTLADRTLFYEDLTQASQALELVFGAAKMNVQILGNAVPHLHAHLVPRYYGDPAPGRPIDPNAHDVALTPQAYEDRVRAIRAALSAS